MDQFRFVDALDESYGDLAGLPAIIPLEASHHKNVGLTVSKTTFKRSTDHVANMIVDNPDDEWSTYKLFMHYIKVAHPPGWKGLIFLAAAPLKVIKARKDGSKHLGWTDLVPDRSTKNRDPSGMKCGGRLGENFPSDNAKRLAERCKIETIGQITGRSARRTGITRVANAGLPQTVSTNFGRHKSDAINFEYQEVSGTTNQKASTACWYKPKKKEVEIKIGTYYFLLTSISFTVLTFSFVRVVLQNLLAQPVSCRIVVYCPLLTVSNSSVFCFAVNNTSTTRPSSPQSILSVDSNAGAPSIPRARRSSETRHRPGRLRHPGDPREQTRLPASPSPPRYYGSPRTLNHPGDPRRYSAPHQSGRYNEYDPRPRAHSLPSRPIIGPYMAMTPPPPLLQPVYYPPPPPTSSFAYSHHHSTPPGHQMSSGFMTYRSNGYDHHQHQHHYGHYHH